MANIDKNLRKFAEFISKIGNNFYPIVTFELVPGTNLEMKKTHLLNHQLDAFKWMVSKLLVRGRSDALSLRFIESLCNYVQKNWKEMEAKFDLANINLYREIVHDRSGKVKEYRVIYLDSCLNPKLDLYMKPGKKVKNALKSPEVQNLKNDPRTSQVINWLKQISILKDCTKEVSFWRDRFVILEALMLVWKRNAGPSGGGNILQVLKEDLQKDIQNVYNELIQTAFVADKLACLLIRDIADFYIPKMNFDRTAIKYTFPVDTWVERPMSTIFQLGENPKLDVIKDRACELFEQFRMNPLHFNAGLWWFGYYFNIDASELLNIKAENFDEVYSLCVSLVKIRGRMNQLLKNAKI